MLNSSFRIPVLKRHEVFTDDGGGAAPLYVYAEAGGICTAMKPIGWRRKNRKLYLMCHLKIPIGGEYMVNMRGIIYSGACRNPGGERSHTQTRSRESG